MKIYLMRHGETDWNREQKIQGREDIPLNDTGVQMAHRCGMLLEAQGIRVHKAITSPLSRAAQTAEIVAGYIGGGRPIVEEGLIERDFGAISGLPLRKDYGLYVPDEQRIPGLEPLKETGERALAALLRHAGEEEGNLLAVSHGGTINAALRVLSSGEIGTGKTHLRNMSVTVLNYEDGKLRVAVLNKQPEEYGDLI